MSFALAVKLGNSSFSFGLAKEDGSAKVIEDQNGDRATSSYVGFTDDEIEVGLAAKQHLVRNSHNTLHAMNTVLGKKFSELTPADLKKFECEVRADENDVALFGVDHLGKKEEYTATEIVSLMIKKIKSVSEHYASQELPEAVVSVPVAFEDAVHKASLQEAFEKAGMDVLRFIEEPICGLLAFDIENDADVLVVDIGGYNVSCSLVHSINGVYNIVESTNDATLGASVFYTRLMQYFAMEFAKKTNLNVTTNKRAIHKLRAECENVMKVLSTATRTSATVESLMDGHDLHVSIERERFEAICAQNFEATLKPIETIFEKTKFDKESITHVIVMGGGAKIPAMQDKIIDMFSMAEVLIGLNPEETVTLGAAKQAAILMDYKNVKQHAECTEVDALAETISFAQANGRLVPVFKKNTMLPSRKVFKTQCASDFLLKLYEGDAKVADDASILREVAVKGITENTSITLNFYANHVGTLRVSAVGCKDGKHYCDVSIHQ